MAMGNMVKLLLIIGIILFSSLHCCSAKRPKPSPKIVAQRTGAARFEEYVDDENASHESKLRKRYSNDPDIEPSFVNDPEIYQGVLGRPGIDFPVMPRIPKTNFDCRNLGNGYFADLDTSCQVFHICDEGRKISFLCPNGTIFRQIDLICDWWFKVDCNAAPDHYAESSEQLQRAQRLRQQSQKLRHVVQSELGFGTSGENFRNDARAAESMQKPTLRLPQGRAFRAPSAKLNKRMDSNGNDGVHRSESSDASEILYSRRSARKEKANEPKELQETAETASFVNNKNGYDYPPPNGYQYLPPQQAYTYPGPKPEKVQKPLLSNPAPFITRATERPSEMFASTVATLDVASTTERRSDSKVGKSLEQAVTTTTTTTTERPQPSKSTASAASTTARRGSTTYASSLKQAENKEPVRSRVQTANSVVAGSNNNNNNLKSTTPSYDSQKINTYTTARKPSAKTKETPFYTPTIPTVRETQATQAPPTTTTEPAVTTTPTPLETATKPTNSEIVKHALEMMESLKELDMEDVLPTEAERYMGNRIGLEVPPSSGPNALHSLALYFANGDTNNTKRMIQLQNGISSVFLSNKTQTKYETLFPTENRPTAEPAQGTTSTSTYKQEDIDNDLETQHSKHPILSAAGTPQLREIAQVFTHALSAYLQDPEQFRKILSEIRPTEPPNVEFNEIPRFVGENEFVRQESAYNVPRQANINSSNKAEDLEIFEFSDSTPKPREPETTTTVAEENEILTTTDASFITTTAYSETLPPASSNLADKTPASRLLTESLEQNAISRTAKQFDSESLRLTAGEINSNLENVRYGLVDSKEDGDGTDYFPENRGNKSNLAPYGFGVKPENSTPISDPYPTSLADTQAVPLHWGDQLQDTTTIDPLSDFEQPTVFAELLPPYDINGTEVFGVPSNRLELPTEETDEHLEHAQSQSFVASRNGNTIFSDEKKSKAYNDYNEEFLLGTTNFGERITTTTEVTPETTQPTTTIRGHFVTKAAPLLATTQAPETTTFEYPTTTLQPESGTFSADAKTTLSYSVFLDPLTINDGLMENEGDDDESVTPSPNTYLPRNELLSSTEEIEPASSTAAQRRGKSSTFATTPLTIRFNGDDSKIIEPMQKRANEMFGKLNETQVTHLMNVMKKADENKTVKRLILLLIQTCDGDDHNKTLEASRTALLNALIGMDDVSSQNDRSEFKIVNTRREKSLRTTTTSTTTPEPLPVTTYRSPNHEKYTSAETLLEDSEATALPLEQATNFNEAATTVEEAPTTTDLPTTTTPTTTTTTTAQTTTTESKPKFRVRSSSQANVRHQKSLGSSDRYQSEPTNSLEHKKADARALELLRSLYSLASRWGRK